MTKPQEVIATQIDTIINGLKQPKKHLYFEDFLQDIHAEQYEGIKDHMSDDFDTWLSLLDGDDWMNFGEMFADKLQK